MTGSLEDLALALELADRADAITVSRFQADDLVVCTKPDLTPVSEADTAVEQSIRERLAVRRPGDSVVGEEYGASVAAGSSRRWIIDPIDGTKNYVRGIPVWATLLALEADGELTVGVVSAPALHRRWWAARGSGAYMTDGLVPAPRALHVSAVGALADAQLCISGLGGWDASVGLESMLALARRVWRTRGFGDFWGYMMVAEGTAEIVCEPQVSLWDLAPALVIVEEAGGRFTDLAGVRTAEGGDALATNGLLHGAALADLRR